MSDRPGSDLPWPDLSEIEGSPTPRLLVISRFRVPPQEAAAFAAQAREAIGVLAESAGFVDASLGQATDDADLRVIATRWDGVGAYRKAMSRYEVKLSVVPFLSLAIDESSAFELVHERDGRGSREASSGLAADAGAVGLGWAAAQSVPAVEA